MIIISEQEKIELRKLHKQFSVIKEHQDSWMSRLKAKLKGVSEEQKEYNREHNLPLDWQGSKEGYHEYITQKEFPSGSN